MENKVGRPSDYTQELADKICSQLSMGKSLRSVCKEEGMPSAQTIFNWFRTNKEFLEQYARAKQESADAMAEEILDISDDTSQDTIYIQKGKVEIAMENKEWVNRSKLRVDTRKWLMAKMKPKVYGEKLDLTSDGKALPTPIYGGQSTKEV